jgi:hypothetical protein
VTPPPSLVSLFVAALNRAGIEYMVTGGLAAVISGHPRLTLDITRTDRVGDRERAAILPDGGRPEVDRPALERWITRLDLQAEWASASSHGERE